MLTGADSTASRQPLETSRRGIFAIGDVRSGSIKRVAAAVGEGAQVVATLHATLAAIGTEPPDLVLAELNLRVLRDILACAAHATI